MVHAYMRIPVSSAVCYMHGACYWIIYSSIAFSAGKNYENIPSDVPRGLFIIPVTETNVSGFMQTCTRLIISDVRLLA